MLRDLQNLNRMALRLRRQAQTARKTRNIVRRITRQNGNTKLTRHETIRTPDLLLLNPRRLAQLIKRARNLMTTARRVQRPRHHRLHTATAHQPTLHCLRVNHRRFLLNTLWKLQVRRHTLQLSQRELQITLDRRTDTVLPLTQAEKLITILRTEREQVRTLADLRAQTLIVLSIRHRRARTTLARPIAPIALTNTPNKTRPNSHPLDLYTN